MEEPLGIDPMEPKPVKQMSVSFTSRFVMHSDLPESFDLSLCWSVCIYQATFTKRLLGTFVPSVLDLQPLQASSACVLFWVPWRRRRGCRVEHVGDEWARVLQDDAGFEDSGEETGHDSDKDVFAV